MNAAIFETIRQLVHVFNPDRIEAYADASILPKQGEIVRSGIGAAFYVIGRKNFSIEVSFPIEIECSSLAELIAIEFAVNICEGCFSVISNDCLSTINVLWGTATPSKYIDSYQRVINKIDNDVLIRYIPRELTEMAQADALAKEASLSGQVRFTYKGT